ncbi:4Fe-4S dicluster domain-containing protein [Desulfovibrio sulfodismutans]|uniref:4Fe-4S dicluster domain-containing protein n=4 Tax=Desulfolutivibrio sulfodismutans TaxID=63561 RepID=A0A7K3NSX1_9BACT|nr:4Fe-4S dicluster domain-containing protein [Desulfolutivibrio sulfodismutans]QLA14481.1 4Fe-4S dicluster domain-containing protein [Desulfolutivibrio sulfodismutans DSM 3696]
MSGSGANAAPRPAIPGPPTPRPPAARPPRPGNVTEANTRQRQKAVIDRTVCTGCGACVACCPTGALSLQAGKASVDRSLCVGCGACLRACPTGAVSLPRARRMPPCFPES